MAVPNTPNADLEQALFRANLKEKKLRQRATLAAIVPVLIGLLWLIYSYAEVATWQTRAEEIDQQEAGTKQREQESQQRVADADARRAEVEASLQTSQEQEKEAKERAADIQQRLVKVQTGPVIRPGHGQDVPLWPASRRCHVVGQGDGFRLRFSREPQLSHYR